MKKILIGMLLILASCSAPRQISDQERSELVKKANTINVRCNQHSSIPLDNFRFYRGISFVKMNCDGNDVLYYCDKGKEWKNVNILSNINSVKKIRSIEIVDNGPIAFSNASPNPESLDSPIYSPILEIRVCVCVHYEDNSAEKKLMSYQRNVKEEWVFTKIQDIQRNYESSEPFPYRIATCMDESPDLTCFFIGRTKDHFEKLHFQELREITQIRPVHRATITTDNYLLIYVKYGGGKYENFYFIHQDGTYEAAPKSY